MHKLRVWWIPQVPMNAFHVEVKDVEQAKLVLKTLAEYDLFQLNNNIKPDYANVGGLEEYQEQYEEWWEWNDENGDDIDTVMRRDNA